MQTNQSKKEFSVYVPSGVVPIKGVVLTLLIGSLGAMFLGMVYAYFSVYNPIFYLFTILGYLAAAVAPLIAGFFSGVATGFGAMAGKVRSPKAVAILGSVCGIAFLWTSWMFWLHLQNGGWTWDGVMIVQTLNSLAGSKYYLLFGSSWPAWAAWSVWGVETVMILGGAAYGAHIMMGDPFCETCNEWTADEDALNFKLVLSDEELGQHLKAGDLQSLLLAEDGFLKDYQVVLSACPKCDASNYLTVKRVESIMNEDGETEEETTDVVANLLLSAESAKQVHQFYIEGKQKWSHRDETADTDKTSAGQTES